MTRNKICTNYDIRHNEMSKEGIERLAAILSECQHVSKIGVSEWLSAECIEILNTALGKNKPGKKGKKKKGKKKK